MIRTYTDREGEPVTDSVAPRYADLLRPSKERYMTEPMVTCPKCQAEIKLTESLAPPLIESTRREYDQRLAQKDAG